MSVTTLRLLSPPTRADLVYELPDGTTVALQISEFHSWGKCTVEADLGAVPVLEKYGIPFERVTKPRIKGKSRS